MSNSIKSICYILLSFLFQISLNEIHIYDISQYIYAIKQIEITEEDSKNLINNLIYILERYVYLDILKSPPQPSDNNYYHNTIYLQYELTQINTQKGHYIHFIEM